MLTYVCNVKSDSDDSDEPEVCPLVVPTFDFELADSESSGHGVHRTPADRALAMDDDVLLPPTWEFKKRGQR